MLTIDPLDYPDYCQSDKDGGSLLAYYRGEGSPGVWRGAGLGGVGLYSGLKVSDEDWAEIRRGRTLEGDAVQGAGDDHRAGWDMTFSAPKSVSAVWAVADVDLKKKIEFAQADAVAAALKHIERDLAFTRRGHGGVELEQLRGLITGQYAHCMSRDADPDLHTHMLLLNIARRADGTVGALEPKKILEFQKAVGALYRAELARQMLKIGFVLEKDREFFQIAGVPQKLCNEWSKGAQRVEADMARRAVEGWVEKQNSNLSTRPPKPKFDPAEVQTKWSAEAEKYGLTARTAEMLSTGYFSLDLDYVPPRAEVAATIYERLVESESVFFEKDLWEAAAIEDVEKGKSPEQIRALVEQLKNDPEIIRGVDRAGREVYTTRAMIRAERNMVERAAAAQTDTSHALPGAAVDAAIANFAALKGYSLDVEQEAAVRHVAQDAGAVKLVRGVAGSGKSTLLTAANIAWTSAGRTVIGCALAADTAKRLEKDTGIASQNLKKLLHQLQNGELKLEAATVVVLDEASMAGSKMTNELLSAAREAGSKVVLVGDDAQLQSIDAGGAFSALLKKIGAAELTKVYRRTAKDESNEAREAAWADRSAAEKVQAGQALEALRDYRKRGMLEVRDTREEACRELVAAWANDARPANEKAMFAAKRKDVFILNVMAREHLKRQGKISKISHEIETKDGTREFSSGDQIVFLSRVPRTDVVNGTRGEILKIEQRRDRFFADIKLDDGKRIRINTSEFNDFDLGYATTVHKVQGASPRAAYVLLSTGKLTQEMLNVIVTRHRHEAKFFAVKNAIVAMTREQAEDQTLEALAKTASKSERKGTTLDFDFPELAEVLKRVPAQELTPE